MDAQEKWQKARDILNNNPSVEQQKEAIGLLNEAYSADHAGAAYTLAQIYYYGSFFERDINKAYTLYKKAIELGFNKNNLLFAQMCIDGSVVEKNMNIHGNMEKQRIKTDYTDFHGLFYLPIESGRNL